MKLVGATLSGAILEGMFLQYSDFKGANLSDAVLIRANLYGVLSGGIIGTPRSLPTYWSLINGYLIGPGANLSNANLEGANLANARLDAVTSGGITGTPAALPTGWRLIGGYLIGPGGANVGYGANLTNANLNGVDPLPRT